MDLMPNMPWQTLLSKHRGELQKSLQMFCTPQNKILLFFNGVTLLEFGLTLVCWKIPLRKHFEALFLCEKLASYLLCSFPAKEIIHIFDHFIRKATLLE